MRLPNLARAGVLRIYLQRGEAANRFKKVIWALAIFGEYKGTVIGKW